MEYKAVSKLLPSLWKQYQPEVGGYTPAYVTILSVFDLYCEIEYAPGTFIINSRKCSTPMFPLFSCFVEKLVVHVGVSGMATSVTLEQCGHNYGYTRLDNCHFCPNSQCCINEGPDCIMSVIDMDSVCEKVNSSSQGVAFSVSKDAGRYSLRTTDSGVKVMSCFMSSLV